MALKTLLNPAFQINESSRATEDLNQLCVPGKGIILASVTKVRESPAVKVILSQSGADVSMSWYDRTSTVLHINLPIKSVASFPIFQDFSTPGTTHRDVRVRFAADSTEQRTEKHKAGEAVLLLEVQISLAGDPDIVIEYFRITQKGKEFRLSHKNISAKEAVPEPDTDNRTLDELELPEMPHSKSGPDDSDSWDLDELLREDSP